MTMKTQHTPGEWKRFGRTVYAGKVPVSLAISTFDAECPPVYANDWRSELIGDDEAEANARLIASAPALLEALQGLELALDRLVLAGQVKVETKFYSAVSSARMTASAAIKAATEGN